jgi:hypothetical protein
MVTTTAADILGLRDGEGSIEDGGVADLVAVKDCGQSPAEAVTDLRPELVILGGRIKLASNFLAQSALGSFVHGFQRISIDSECAGVIDSDVKQLLMDVESRTGSPCRLAGRAVAS